VAASCAEGEEMQRRASSRGGECAPEGRSLGGGAGHAGCSGGAGAAGCSAAPGRTRRMTHGMSLFHLAVMQQTTKKILF